MTTLASDREAITIATKAAALLPVSDRAAWATMSATLTHAQSARIKSNLGMLELLAPYNRLELLASLIGGVGYDDSPASDDPFDLDAADA